MGCCYQGAVEEFRITDGKDPSQVQFQFQWRFANGLFGLILAFGLLSTSLKSRSARSWRYGTAWMRSFIADYGVPVMVIAWTGVSYSAAGHIPSAIPKRLQSPLAWSHEARQTWTVIQDMGKVPVSYIFAALIPAIMITCLYWFDHSVASQLAQQKDFNLRNPSAYHYDILVLGFMVVISGLIGLPPSNGVLPQSPMHTKSLVTLRRQITRKKLMKTARESIEKKATLTEVYERMQETFQKLDTPPSSIHSPASLIPQHPALKNLTELKDLSRKDSKGKTKIVSLDVEDLQALNVIDGSLFDPEKHVDALLPVRVKEQRLSNLMQSVMVGLCVAAMPIIKKIPTSVLWGYFAYMALDSLPGNQLWERSLLLFVMPNRRFKVLENDHASFVETVPFKAISAFTIFQIVYLLACFGVTWIPIAGVLFPVLFLVLIPIRQYILPKYFNAEYLWELDAAEYEEAPAIHREKTDSELSRSHSTVESLHDEMSDAEILDEITTRSRVELKHRIAQIGKNVD